jgi:hypothetical protein
LELTLGHQIHDGSRRLVKFLPPFGEGPSLRKTVELKVVAFLAFVFHLEGDPASRNRVRRHEGVVCGRDLDHRWGVCSLAAALFGLTGPKAEGTQRRHQSRENLLAQEMGARGERRAEQHGWKGRPSKKK